jgi:hypothetical protein
LEWKDYTPSKEWEWPCLSQRELREACSTKIKGKTPSPDCITQEIISRAFQVAPNWFFKVYSILIDIGYHPKTWKQATRVILKKLGKPDYLNPKAYRVIALLNCLGKVSERILARRLGYLAETSTLLFPTQMGGRLKKSAIDTTLSLLNEVETNKRPKEKPPPYFLM